jgi:short-subunit dehydrogenase
MGGKLVFPGGGVYHATKHAVEALSDALRFEVRNFGIGVSIIEPGLIKTEFAHAASTAIDEGTSADGTYSDFNREVAEKTIEAYEGPMARLAAGPDAVAKVIERAITSRRPKPRYMVTAGARVLLATRRMLPDRGWDLMMRSQYPSPGKG